MHLHLIEMLKDNWWMWSSFAQTRAINIIVIATTLNIVAGTDVVRLNSTQHVQNVVT